MLLSLSEAMLKKQAERARKSDLTKKAIYNKDGKVKNVVTILKDLQREAEKHGK